MVFYINFKSANFIVVVVLVLLTITDNAFLNNKITKINLIFILTPNIYRHNFF